MLPDLPGPILKELCDIPLTDEEERGEFAFHLLDDEYLKRTWAEHREELLASWVEKHPGTRPQAWWRHDAPREPPGTRPGCSDDGQVEEPRRRLGGTGTPEHEALNVSTSYWLGIPSAWVSPEDVAYYTGTARDIRGELINAKAADDPEPFLGVAIEPADPPTYEAQASYLKRHKLLLRGEEARLGPANFGPEEVQP